MGGNASKDKPDPDKRILGAARNSSLKARHSLYSEMTFAAACTHIFFFVTLLQSFLTPSNKMDIWKKYSRKHKLGSGMCGPVYVIKDNRTGQEFAGKSVRKNALNARLQCDLQREIGILKQAQ